MTSSSSIEWTSTKKKKTKGTMKELAAAISATGKEGDYQVHTYSNSSTEMNIEQDDDDSNSDNDEEEEEKSVSHKKHRSRKKVTSDDDDDDDDDDRNGNMHRRMLNTGDDSNNNRRSVKGMIDVSNKWAGGDDDDDDEDEADEVNASRNSRDVEILRHLSLFMSRLRTELKESKNTWTHYVAKHKHDELYEKLHRYVQSGMPKVAVSMREVRKVFTDEEFSLTKGLSKGGFGLDVANERPLRKGEVEKAEEYERPEDSDDGRFIAAEDEAYDLDSEQDEANGWKRPQPHKRLKPMNKKDIQKNASKLKQAPAHKKKKKPKEEDDDDERELEEGEVSDDDGRGENSDTNSFQYVTQTLILNNTASADFDMTGPSAFAKNGDSKQSKLSSSSSSSSTKQGVKSTPTPRPAIKQPIKKPAPVLSSSSSSSSSSSTSSSTTSSDNDDDDDVPLTKAKKKPSSSPAAPRRRRTFTNAAAKKQYDMLGYALHTKFISANREYEVSWRGTDAPTEVQPTDGSCSAAAVKTLNERTKRWINPESSSLLFEHMSTCIEKPDPPLSSSSSSSSTTTAPQVLIHFILTPLYTPVKVTRSIADHILANSDRVDVRLGSRLLTLSLNNNNIVRDSADDSIRLVLDEKVRPKLRKKVNDKMDKLKKQAASEPTTKMRQAAHANVAEINAVAAAAAAASSSSSTAATPIKRRPPSTSTPVVMAPPVGPIRSLQMPAKPPPPGQRTLSSIMSASTSAVKRKDAPPPLAALSSAAVNVARYYHSFTFGKAGSDKHANAKKRIKLFANDIDTLYEENKAMGEEKRCQTTLMAMLDKYGDTNSVIFGMDLAAIMRNEDEMMMADKENVTPA